MKKVLFATAALMLFCISESLCQIVVQESGPKSIPIGECKDFANNSISCTKSESVPPTYVFCFRNAEFTTITDIQCFSFSETGEDFEKLYSIISSNLLLKEESEVELTLPTGTLSLVFGKGAGGKSWVCFNWSQNGIDSHSGFYNQKQIDKLFGR